MLSKGQKLSVDNFAVDMDEPFILTIKDECPYAKICIARFLLAKRANQAFDELRKSEFKKANKTNNQFMQGMLEPHRRFILVSRLKDLSKAECRLIDKLRYVNNDIHIGVLPIEYFHKTLDQRTVQNFREVLKRWHTLAR